MRSEERSSRVYGRTVVGMLLVATFVLALAAPVGLQSAAAQEDVAIQTRVQILHASPDLGKVEVHINNNEVLDEFVYGNLSDWIDIDPGSDRVTITQDRAGFNYAVFDAMYPVRAGEDYYLIISNDIVMTAVVDRSPIAGGAARVRIAQAAVDLPAVNVIATKENLNFATQLTYPRSSEYTTVPAGTYELTVKLADTGEVALTMPGVVLEGNMVYDLVIMGRPNDEDKPLKFESLSDTTTEKSPATPSS
jgi:Domain of unknown function (DUF4397)